MELTAKELFLNRFSPKMASNLFEEQQAFQKMYNDVGGIFFARLIGCFGNHITDRFLDSDQMDIINPIAQYVQVRIHENFVIGKRDGAWKFMDHLRTLSTNLNLIRHVVEVPHRGGDENPFYAVHTKESFRYLFGSPDEVSYAAALLFAEDYLHFGAAIYTLAMRKNTGKYPDFMWSIPNDWANNPVLGFENYLVATYASHAGYSKLFSSPEAAELARVSYNECFAKTCCTCTCYLCCAIKRKCVKRCVEEWPYDCFVAARKKGVKLEVLQQELTDVAIEHSPFCYMEFTTKKPREEFDKWGAYPHNPQLFDIFSSTANDPADLFIQINTFLYKQLQEIDLTNAFPVGFAKPLKEYVLGQVGRSHIGVIFQSTKDTVELMHDRRNCWKGFARYSTDDGDSDFKMAMKNSLKVVALRLSAGLSSVRALMKLLARACVIGHQEYELGPYRLRGMESDVHGIVKRFLEGGLPEHDDPNSPLDSFCEWMWAMKVLYEKSKIHRGGKSVHLLEAVIDQPTIGTKLEYNYQMCCMARIAQELSVLGFDQQIVNTAKLVSGQFFLRNGTKIQHYLDHANDQGQCNAWIEYSITGNSVKTGLSNGKAPTHFQEKKKGEKESLETSIRTVPTPTPRLKVVSTRKQVLSPTSEIKMITKKDASVAASSKTGVLDKKNPSVAAFGLHIASSSQRLLMLTKQLPCPRYDESLEDGAYILLRETVNVIPHYIAYASYELDKQMHGDFISVWRDKETAVITAVSSALLQGRTSKVPIYPNAVDLFEKDCDLLTLACLRAKKFMGTSNQRFIMAAVDRFSKDPFVADLFATPDGGTDRGPHQNLERSFKTASAIARSFDKEMDVALALTVVGKGGIEVAG